ncbi:phage tail protein [Haliangium ochraceum]|uniref:phage tail protein n=1 Tax=Haliangium ochraceum TaxID=80816 RepID=UPI00019BB1CF|nr:phage tail protein [Haliangium ochraceum]
MLQLDGSKVVGVIRSVDGGGVKSEIMTYQMGSKNELWRQIGKPKYEDLKLEFGMSMTSEFYKWLQTFFRGEVDRRTGAILAGDFHYKERARRSFQEALISEVTFPSLDGQDKNPCYMSVTIVPETLRFEKGTSQSLESQIGQMRQKLWTSSNFDFRLDGFQSACRRVTKIDSFTIKRQVHEYHAGNLRDPMRVPGILEFPNLTFYLPEVDAEPFIKHYNKYGIQGTVQQPARLTGAIECMDNAGDTLCTVELKGVDVANVTPQKSDTTSDDIKQVKVEIAVESMVFKPEADAVG